MKYENFLKKTILPQLELGRPNWDKPHTVLVVKYLKDILKNTPQFKLDHDVLLISAYAHDWGYANLFDKSKNANIKDVSNAKKLHMQLGAKMIKKLLKDPHFSSLNQEQKDRIVYLVRTHDDFDLITDLDQKVLLEADTLSGIDSVSIKPSFDPESYQKYLQGVQKKRFPFFVTPYAIKLYKTLYEKSLKYYQ